MNLTRPPQLRPLVAYLFALLAPLLALGLQISLVPYARLVPFILFFPAVFFASWLGGLGPGIVATVLSALLANFFLLEPLVAPSATREAVFLTLLFAIVCSIINFLSSSLRAAFQAQDRLLREARDAVRVRDEFLSVAGHELKTPLTALLLQLELLDRTVARGGPQEASQAVARVEKLRDHTRRLERLINQLLDVSRLTVGQLQLEREEVDVGAVAEEVVNRFSDLALRSGSPLHLRREGPCLCQGDRARLEQVLTNLVSNAVKYGAGKPVSVSVESEHDQVILQVRDEGIGIDVAHQQRIFERFERAVSERHYGGLGLGLWITRQIVEAGGGTISVKSVSGQGSTFTVRLPQQPPNIQSPDRYLGAQAGM